MGFNYTNYTVVIHSVNFHFTWTAYILEPTFFFFFFRFLVNIPTLTEPLLCPQLHIHSEQRWRIQCVSAWKAALYPCVYHTESCFSTCLNNPKEFGVISTSTSHKLARLLFFFYVFWRNGLWSAFWGGGKKEIYLHVYATDLTASVYSWAWTQLQTVCVLHFPVGLFNFGLFA